MSISSKNRNFKHLPSNYYNIGTPPKFEVTKNKKKSLIPLPTPNNAKSQCTPSMHKSIINNPIPEKKCSTSTILRRNSRSIHSSSIPISHSSNNSAEDNASNLSEGSLISISTSKASVAKSTERLLKWKENKIYLQILQMEENSDDENVETLSYQSYSPALVEGASKEELPKQWISRLALQSSKTAYRTRGYFLCPICSEPFSRPAVIACGHMHCMHCVCNWLEDQDNCPVCRYRIILKNVSNTLLAKEFFQSSYLLASIFTAGNFHADFIHEKNIFPNVDSLSENLNLSNHKVLNEFISSEFKRMFTEEIISSSNDANKRNNNDLASVNEGHCFVAAIWLLRHGLQLTSIYNFQRFLKYELYQQDSDISTEAFLKRVMHMKKSIPNNEGNANFRIPRLSLANNTRNNQRHPRFRFKLPSTQALGKILITCFIFIVIALAVHLLEDGPARNTEFTGEKMNFYKLDFLVYTLTVFSMATYTETERIAYWRRRRRANNGILRERRHQGRRRRR